MNEFELNIAPLNSLEQDFIQHFGDMGSRWGINRTVGQMYALLFIREQPLNAEQIAHALNLSRSNVSMGIKELLAWNLLNSQQIPGDRKTYYATPDDVWQIARTLITEKRKREIDPTLSMLRSQLMHAHDTEQADYALGRMQAMHDLMELLVSWSDEMQTLQSARLKRLFTLGSHVNKVLDMTERVTGKR